jgi:hypothetical protein
MIPSIPVQLKKIQLNTVDKNPLDHLNSDSSELDEPKDGNPEEYGLFFCIVNCFEFLS